MNNDDCRLNDPTANKLAAAGVAAWVLTSAYFHIWWILGPALLFAVPATIYLSFERRQTCHSTTGR